MPEQHIHDFTNGIVPTSGDLVNLQRQVNGVWQNYCIDVDDIIEGGIIDEDFGIQTIIAGPIVMIPAPPAGMFNLIQFGWVRYTPGSAFDGAKFDVEIIDGYSVVHGVASFNFSPNSSAAPLVRLNFPLLNSPGTAIYATLAGPTLADGDLRVWLQYQQVFI